MQAVAFGVLVLFAVSSVTQAQNLQSRIDGANQRWTEYREQLASSDPVTRAEALHAALADENMGIRNNALRLVLRDRDTLPVAIVLRPGGRLDPGDLPTLEVGTLRWDVDKRSFAGVVRSQRVYSRTIGELSEGKLQIRYVDLRMPSNFGLSEDSPRAKRDIVARDCSVVLAIDPSDSSLKGPVRCDGLSQTFDARMPLD